MTIDLTSRDLLLLGILAGLDISVPSTVVRDSAFLQDERDRSLISTRRGQEDEIASLLAKLGQAVPLENRWQTKKDSSV